MIRHRTERVNRAQRQAFENEPSLSVVWRLVHRSAEEKLAEMGQCRCYSNFHIGRRQRMNRLSWKHPIESKGIQIHRQQHRDYCRHFRTDSACGSALSLPSGEPQLGSLVFFDVFGGVSLTLRTLKVRTLRIDSCRTLSTKR
jgi:hypothetical protein